MNNLLTAFRALLPRTPLLIGTVQTVTGADLRIQTPDGGIYQARSTLAHTPGDTVYFRPGGSVEGTAPTLPAVLIEV